MGSRLVKVDFTPRENEQIEAIIKVPEEPRSIIHGIVRDCNDKIIENAVVKLYELENPGNPCSLRPITHTFTDECGQFLFGPLAAGRHYVIKVWVNDVKSRHIVIRPDNDEKNNGMLITQSNTPFQASISEEGDMTQPVKLQMPPAGKAKPSIGKPNQPIY